VYSAYVAPVMVVIVVAADAGAFASLGGKDVAG
jgi:hypothetical protein